jgi:hypothetical protein
MKDTVKISNTPLTKIPIREEKNNGTKTVFEEITVSNSKLTKDINSHIFKS